MRTTADADENDLQWLRLNASRITSDLLAQWQGLVDRAESSDPFLTPQWLLPWLEAGNGRNLLLAAFRRERLSLLAPIQQRPLGLQMGGFLNSEQQDLALICPDESAENLAGSLTAHLNRAQIRLDGVLQRDALSMVRQWEAAGWKAVVDSGKQSPYVRVDTDWETYLGERNRNCRRNYLRRSRKMERELPVRKMVVTSMADVAEWLPAMERLERSTWKSATGLFSPGHIQLTRKRLMALASMDKLRLFLLAAEGRLLAYEMTWLHQGRLWDFNGAFDVRYKALGPGIVLMAEVIKYGFAHGLQTVELLGGNQPYKRQWARAWRQRTTVHLFAPGLSAILGKAGLRFWRLAKSCLKRRRRA